MSKSFKSLADEEWFLKSFVRLGGQQSKAKECADLAVELNIPKSMRMGFVMACVSFVKEFGKVPTKTEAKAFGLEKGLSIEEAKKKLETIAKAKA